MKIVKTIIIKEIPAELKTQFKTLCARRDKTIKDEIIRLMDKEVKAATTKRQWSGRRTRATVTEDQE